MAISLNTLASAKGARTKKFRVGRGEGSGSGKTAGRGTKGQRSRSGGRNKLKLKGIRSMVLAFPKLRGFKSRYMKDHSVSLEKLAAKIGSETAITLKTLKAVGLVPKSAVGAKIIGEAKLDKALHFVNIKASATAKDVVEKAGGSFVVPPVKKNKKRV
ncbi:MAG: 50S ribosomal protein L15 [Patescibacteria group bacterium]|nr:50S ribosomal protein L15 [Patescibacteria group bacterium]